MILFLLFSLTHNINMPTPVYTEIFNLDPPVTMTKTASESEEAAVYSSWIMNGVNNTCVFIVKCKTKERRVATVTRCAGSTKQNAQQNAEVNAAGQALGLAQYYAINRARANSLIQANKYKDVFDGLSNAGKIRICNENTNSETTMPVRDSSEDEYTLRYYNVSIN